MIVQERPSTIWLDRAFMALFGLALVVFALYNIISVDVWWQIKTGEWILQNGIPATDPFNYQAANLPWIEMRWLYSILVYLIFQGLGLNGLILLKLLFLGLTFFVLGRFYQGRHRWLVYFGLTVTLAITHGRFFIRPELVSYLLLTIFLFSLYRYKGGGSWRWLAPLPLLQIIWTNSHTLFILGPVIIWLFALVELAAPKVLEGLLRPEPQPLSFQRLRPVFAAAAAVTLACLVNPYFVQGALFPFQLFSEINSGHIIKDLISEFLSPFAYAGFNLPHLAYLVVIGLSFLSFILTYKRFVASAAVITAAFFYLSLLAIRNVALFGFVAGFMLIYNLGRLAESDDFSEQIDRSAGLAARVVVGLFILVMIPAILTNAYYRNTDKAFGFGVAVQRFPIEAMTFARANNLPEPILNNLGDGGYLIFEGGPRSVFSDGRLEVYGGQRVEQAVRLFQLGTGFDEVVVENDIQTVLLHHATDQGLMRLIEAREAWQPVYYDSQYLIYLRQTAETAQLIEQLAFDWPSPKTFTPLPQPDWLPPALLSGIFPTVSSNREEILLGELFLNTGNLDQALAYFDQAIAKAPVNDTVRFYRGVIYRAKGDERTAADIFAELDESYLKQGAVHILAAAIYEAAGNNRAALAAYQQSLDLGLRTENTYRAIARLALAEQDYLAAVTALVELAQLKPDDPGIWNELGTIYLEIGDLDRARRAFEQALTIDPNYLPALENLNALAPQ